MSHPIRYMQLIALIIALPLPVGAQATLPPPSANLRSAAAPSALAWYDGQIQKSYVNDCVNGVLEDDAWAWVGFQADPNAAKPAPNTTYYIHVVIAGVGNPCSQRWVYPEVILPASTSLAITLGNPVKCFYDNVQDLSGECPQTLPLSLYTSGAYAILSPVTQYQTWPLPKGHILDIQIPVMSSATLNNSPFQANVWMLDTGTWLHPQVGVYVFSNTPMVLYPSPSTIITSTVDLMSYAYIYAYGLGGTMFFDLGTDTSYGVFTASGPISSGGNAYLAWYNWRDGSNNLVVQPDTLYHFRVRFVASNGITYYGADQTFHTLSDGSVTIGNGTPADCTAANLQAQIDAVLIHDIRFNCGALPITITIASQIITSAGEKTIDGNNKVTLVASSGNRHFLVSAATRLILKNLTLTQGVVSGPSDCGGSIYVQDGARLDVIDSQLLNNSSAYYGGAICIGVGAIGYISNTMLMGNNAVNGGGALWMVHDAIVLMYYSDVSNNNGGMVNGRGGGVGGDINSEMDAYYSLFYGNQAYRGGAISCDGCLNLIASTVSGNHSNAEPGGIDGNPYLFNVTLVGNWINVNPFYFFEGGGLAGNAKLVNTIVAGNWPSNCSNGSFRPVVFSSGHNIEDSNSCHLTGAGDKVNTNPMLSTLRMNGGRTHTYALLAGSPAINAGDNSGCVFASCIDQRGVPMIGGTIDIGAYEYWPHVYLPMARK